MNFFKLLWLPITRRKVDDSIISDFEGILEAELHRRKLHISFSVSDAMLKRLVQEAYFRAGRIENDGIPRYGRMSDELDDIAQKISLIDGGSSEADPEISRILVQHGFKEKHKHIE